LHDFLEQNKKGRLLGPCQLHRWNEDHQQGGRLAVVVVVVVVVVRFMACGGAV